MKPLLRAETALVSDQAFRDSALIGWRPSISSSKAEEGVIEAGGRTLTGKRPTSIEDAEGSKNTAKEVSSGTTYTTVGSQRTTAPTNLLKDPTPQNVELASSIHQKLVGQVLNHEVPGQVARGWLGTVYDSLSAPKGWFANKLSSFRQVSSMNPSDSKQIAIALKRRGARIDKSLVEKYYQRLSAFDKTPRAMVKVDPETDSMIESLRKTQEFDYKILGETFAELLGQEEWLRRERVLSSQAREIKNAKAWDQRVLSLSQELNLRPREIREAGETLQIGIVFPSFMGRDALKTLEEIESLRAPNPTLFRALQKYLGKSAYDTRMNLLKTAAEMKHLKDIPSLPISAWLTQGLKVRRMLKIIDYTMEMFKDGKMTPIESQLITLEQAQKAKKLFLSNTPDGILWVKSLENDQILRLSDPIKSQYLELQKAVEQMDLSRFTKNTGDVSTRSSKESSPLALSDGWSTQPSRSRLRTAEVNWRRFKNGLVGWFSE